MVVWEYCTGDFPGGGHANCQGMPSLPLCTLLVRKDSISFNYMSSSDSMDRDDSDGDWDGLGHDLQLSILSVLKQRKDKNSLQAVMQTSRDLRLLASSLISSIEIRVASALADYPRLAAITSMQLRMMPSPGEARMEPPDMVSWLQATSAAGNRLAAVTIVEVELPGILGAMAPATMDCLLTSIARACPNLRCLRMYNIKREEDVVRAMFTAIGQHLPGIIELQLALDLDQSVYDFAIAGIDWAACLPRGLQKFSSSIQLHHELLQQLVLMPALTEVTVWGLSIGGEEHLEVQSKACAWRILRTDFPSFQLLGRFSAAMPFLQLRPYEDDDQSLWNLGADVEGPAVAKAAAWLSKLCNCPKELTLSLGQARSVSSAGLLSSLAPLSGRLVSLGLGNWPVSVRTLDELAEALPNVCTLSLWSCSISDSSAWSRMLALTSVTDLRIYGPADNGSTIPLAQIMAFASAIARPMALTVKGGAVSIEDQESWEAFEEVQRRNNGLQHVTVRITQKKHYSYFSSS